MSYENNTLSTYYKRHNFNPTTFSLNTEDEYRAHANKRNNLYVNKLGLPNLLWRGANILEVGCSSGENSLVLARLGAKFTFVEPLESSVVKLIELFKMWGVEDAIEGCHVTTIENFQSDSQYDAIIAEGFIFTLKKRKDIMRKLFTHLSKNGLLILSTIDPIGVFIEYFKVTLACLYCHQANIIELDQKVQAVKPFFELDFNKIPHSRPFTFWAKDNLFNPFFNPNSFYGFCEIISDLADLNPYYYNSWPSYKHFNDLTWHKKVPSYQEHIESAINGYKLRRLSFLLGESLLDEKEAIKLLLVPNGEEIIQQVEKVICAMTTTLNEKKTDFLIYHLSKLLTLVDGSLKDVVKEMLIVSKDISPDVYSRCINLRKFFGVPYHYIILSRESSLFI